jgi:CO/xanthine dehydrogenase FAD-binding subunit
MKPVAFEYLTPGTVEEALVLIGKHGEDAKILAGWRVGKVLCR